MNSAPQAVTPLRQSMLEDMRMRKLSPKTQSRYIRAVRRLAKYPGRSPDTASVEELRNYAQLRRNEWSVRLWRCTCASFDLRIVAGCGLTGASPNSTLFSDSTLEYALAQVDVAPRGARARPGCRR